jgi:hypothetical protein
MARIRFGFRHSGFVICSDFEFRHSGFANKETTMSAGIIGHKSIKHRRNRRTNNTPAAATPINVVSVSFSTATCTITFDQPVSLSGVPGYTSQADQLPVGGGDRSAHRRGDVHRERGHGHDPVPGPGRSQQLRRVCDAGDVCVGVRTAFGSRVSGEALAIAGGSRGLNVAATWARMRTEGRF